MVGCEIPGWLCVCQGSKCNGSRNGQSRLRNKDGWWGLARRLFRTKSVMERLWNDHFGHLGYLPKFHGVQNARFIMNSSNGSHFTSMLTKNHCTNPKTSQHPSKFWDETRFFSKMYKDQNDRTGKIYRLKKSLDFFSLKNRGISTILEKQLFFNIHPYIWVWYNGPSSELLLELMDAPELRPW